MSAHTCTARTLPDLPSKSWFGRLALAQHPERATAHGRNGVPGSPGEYKVEYEPLNVNEYQKQYEA